MIQGSCCCGAVRFELTAPPTMMATCHCTRCRKVGLGAFVFVDRAALRWVSGQDMVESYQPDPPYEFSRCFCRRCGTALGEPLSPADSFPIAANCLDSDPGVRNRFHEFVAEKPAWYEICDGAKQFEGYPVRGPT